MMEELRQDFGSARVVSTGWTDPQLSHLAVLFCPVVLQKETFLQLHTSFFFFFSTRFVTGSMQSAILAILGDTNILADVGGCKNITVHPRWSSGRRREGLMSGGVGTQTRFDSNNKRPFVF